MVCSTEYTAWVLEMLIGLGMIITVCAAAVLIIRMLLIYDRDRRADRRGVILQTKEQR